MVRIMSQHFFSLCNHFYLPTCVTFFNSLNFSLDTKYTTVKHLINSCPNLHVCLNRVYESLGLDNSVRKSNYIGFDILVILHVFNKIKTLYFHTQFHLPKHAGVLYGTKIPWFSLFTIFLFLFSSLLLSIQYNFQILH